MNPDADAVLDFWFGDVTRGGPSQGPDAWRGHMMRWFGGSPELDAEIRDRFGALHARAAAGELDGWAATPRELLALVILLDQFSRNLHRGTPAAFAQDAKARELTNTALERGDDAGFEWYERTFLIIPLGHSESLADHDRVLAYLDEVWSPLVPASLGPIAAMSHGQANGHRETIARFGRYPARNQALGRTSTPDETAYLAAQEQPR